MQSLRNAHRIARFVLVWFALSIGVAIASPMVHPQSIQWVCSGSGSIKVVVSGADGQASSSLGHTLDCPLCASTLAPPPTGAQGLAFAAPQRYAMPWRHAEQLAVLSAAPPPARGPPALL